MENEFIEKLLKAIQTLTTMLNESLETSRLLTERCHTLREQHIDSLRETLLSIEQDDAEFTKVCVHHEIADLEYERHMQTVSLLESLVGWDFEE